MPKCGRYPEMDICPKHDIRDLGISDPDIWGPKMGSQIGPFPEVKYDLQKTAFTRYQIWYMDRHPYKGFRHPGRPWSGRGLEWVQKGSQNGPQNGLPDL